MPQYLALINADMQLQFSAWVRVEYTRYKSQPHTTQIFVKMEGMEGTHNGGMTIWAGNCYNWLRTGLTSCGGGRSVITLYLISWEGGTPPTPHMVTSSPQGRVTWPSPANLQPTSSGWISAPLPSEIFTKVSRTTLRKCAFHTSFSYLRFNCKCPSI